MVSVRAVSRRVSACSALLVALSCVLVLLLSSSPSSVSAAVIGIDLGQEWVKTSLVKPGVPLGIVLNEHSKRKDPMLVGFNDGERVVGENAVNALVRRPLTVFPYVKSFVGARVDDPAIAAFVSDMKLPFALETVVDRGTVGFRVDGSELSGGDVFSVEELLAMVLSHSRKHAEAMSGEVIRDCVITVPAFFTQRQRQAVLDAAVLADLNVLSLVHDHVAVALQYGIQNKVFDSASHTAVFVDVGSGSARAAVVRYDNSTTEAAAAAAAPAAKKGGKKAAAPKEVAGRMQVLGVAWDQEVSGSRMDVALADLIVRKWRTRADSVDVSQDQRALTRIRREATRTKEVLSANADTPVFIEALLGDTDLHAHVSREEFEASCSSMVGRLLATVSAALERAGVTQSDINAVVLVGGASRIPFVKRALTESFGSELISMSINADEAAALGAGFFAARLSTSFRVRAYQVFDWQPYDVRVSVSVASESSSEGATEQTVASTAVLFARGSPVPSKKHVSFPRLADIGLLVNYDESSALHDRQILDLELVGVLERAQRVNHTGSGVVKVSLRMGMDGVVRVVDSDVQVDVIVPVKQNVTATPVESSAGADASAGASEGADSAKGSDDGASDASASGESSSSSSSDANSSSADGEGAAGGEDDSSSTASEEQQQQQQQDQSADQSAGDAGAGAAPATRTVTRRLRVDGRERTGSVVPLAADVRAAYRSRLATVDRRERERQELGEARNALESFIYATRERYGDEALHAVTTGEQRDAIEQGTNEAADWLDYDSFEAPVAEFRRRLAALRALADPPVERLAELEARPQSVDVARAFLNASRAAIESWATSKPHITEDERSALLTRLQEFEEWLNDVTSRQDAVSLTEAPAFKSAQVDARVGTLTTAVGALSAKPKPKPKPQPKPAASSKKNATAAEDGGAAADTASTDDAPPEQQKASEEESSSQQQQQQQQSGADNAGGQRTADADRAERLRRARQKRRAAADDDAPSDGPAAELPTGEADHAEL